MEDMSRQDFEWQAIKPLPPNKPQGVPRVGDRRVLLLLAPSADQIKLLITHRIHLTN